MHLHIFEEIFEKAFKTEFTAAVELYKASIAAKQGRSMYHFTDTEGKAIVSDWNGSQACFEKRFCGMSHEIMD